MNVDDLGAAPGYGRNPAAERCANRKSTRGDFLTRSTPEDHDHTMAGER